MGKGFDVTSYDVIAYDVIASEVSDITSGDDDDDVLTNE